jgi:hypothetical protein
MAQAEEIRLRHSGSLMPDDREAVLVQEVTQSGDRGLLLEKSTDRIAAAL